MSGGGGGSKTQVVQQSSSIDPYIRQLYAEAYGTAQALGRRPYTPYPVDAAIAPFSPDTQDYFNQVRILGGYAPEYIYPAAGVIKDVATAGAPTVEPFLMSPASINRSDIRTLKGGTFPGADLNAYLNPYTNAVIDTTLQDLNRAREIALNDVGDAAIRAGAFGGARHGVAEAETNRAFAQEMAKVAAQLRAQGFDTAARLIEADLSRGLQAGTANQAADLATATANARMQQEAAAANAAIQNEVAKQNAARELLVRQLQLQGAGSLLGLGLTGLDALRQAGAAETAQEQAKRDFAYQEFLRSLEWPERQLALRTSVLHGMPVSLSSTSTTKLPGGSTAGSILGGSILGATVLGPALGQVFPALSGTTGGLTGAVLGGLLGVL